MSTNTAKESSTDILIHSSLSPLLNPSLDFYYPSRHTEIGIRITQSSSASSKGGYHLHSECPNPWTITTGEDLGSQEDISIADLDSIIRTLLLAMAEHCRNLAAEIEAQAVRLESIAAADRDILLSDLSTPSAKAPKAPVADRPIADRGHKQVGRRPGRQSGSSTRLSLNLEDLDLD